MKTKLNLLFTLLLVSTLHAQVLPPGFTLFGKNAAEYSAEWNVYNYSLSTNQSLLFPPAGSLGDPVYFLQADFLGAPGLRTFTIPDNVYIFFPIVSAEADNIDTVPPFTVDELREHLEALLNAVTNLAATIDGQSLANPFAYLAPTPVFTLFLTTNDNYFSLYYGHPIEDLIDPVVCGGFWLMLDPLPVGSHTLNVLSAFGPPYDVTLNTDFQINIVPAPVSEHITTLSQRVADADLSPLRLRSLQATLRRAGDSLQHSHPRTGIARLRVFQSKVRNALRQKPALRDELRRGAQALIDRAGEKTER